MYIDSHAHLFFKDFQGDIDDVINRALGAGVDYIICPGTDLETSKSAIDLAEKYEIVFACVGFHPHDASKADSKSLEKIEELSIHPKVVAIGEVGLDYHYNFSLPEKQREVFGRQIEIARRRDLPVVIHSREAEDDTLTIVEEGVRHESHLRGVFHCFPGDVTMAKKIIGWGFCISIPGPVTFGAKPGRASSMAEVVSRVSMENILLETDSPYLAPIPFRGKRNEPAYVPIIAKRVAELQGRSVEEIGRMSSAAAKRLFRIGKESLG